MAAGAGSQTPPAGGADAPENAPEPVATLPDGTRRVRGHVVTPRDSSAVGVPGVWVTLHRVGPDAAGPLDSVRTDGRGGYAITYRPRGDARAVYFVAASRGGIAYFGAPLTRAVVEDESAELTVFDTTSAPGRLQTSGRHLIVARPGPGGAREVLEVFELSNDTRTTFVPPAASPRGVWSTALPRGAANFAARESGDLPADGVVAVGGRAALMVPVAPGVKQVAFTYRLPGDAFPLRVPVDSATGVLEVLIEDPQGSATGAGLAPAAAVALEGKTFQRFLAQSVSGGGSVEVRVGEAPDRGAPRYAVPLLLLGVGGAMAAVLVVAGRRRAAPVAASTVGTPVRPRAARPVAPGAAPAAGDDERDRLLAELAALDDAFAASTAANASEAERAAYAERRGAIKARLAAELAGTHGRG